MYLRHSTITKNGKAHAYWRLVRSVRVGRKVRQETVAQLGELDAKGRIAARHLADSIIGRERQPGLFDEELPTEPVTVVPSRLSLKVQGQFFDFFWGMRAASLDNAISDHMDAIRWSDPLSTIACSSSGIARLSGPIWDRANRVT